MTTSTISRRFAAIAAIGLAVASCGGSDGDADDEPTDAPAETPAEEPADDTGEDSDAAEADTGETDTGDASTGENEAPDENVGDDTDSGGKYEPGDITFRSVNLLDRPVDIYVRTTGLVEAFPIEAGVAPGTVTDYAAPPADGSYIVTEAGAGDPTCVTQCDHFIADLSGVFGEGPTRTVLLYEDEFDGASAFDLSEEPDSAESAATSANLLQPADPTTGLVIPIGIALDPDVFGFRVGFTGVTGCVESPEQPGILVGGNQTPAYPYPGDDAEILFFEQPDQECETPVGGPFPISGGPGTRTLVVLQGAGGSLTAITIDLSGVAAADAGGDDDTAEEADGGDETGDAAPTTRGEFVEALLEDAPPGTDEQCVTDIVDRLSDEDIQVVLDNLDSADIPPGLSPEGLETLSGIIDCAP